MSDEFQNHVSIIWSPTASTTDIKLQTLQNTALRIVHLTLTINICMTKHTYYNSTHAHLKLCASQIKQTLTLAQLGRNKSPFLLSHKVGPSHDPPSQTDAYIPLKWIHLCTCGYTADGSRFVDDPYAGGTTVRCLERQLGRWTFGVAMDPSLCDTRGGVEYNMSVEFAIDRFRTYRKSRRDVSCLLVVVIYIWTVDSTHNNYPSRLNQE